MKKIFPLLLLIILSCSKESSGGGDDPLLARNAALNTQIAALNAQAASLNTQISLLRTKVAENSSLQASIDSKTAELSAAISNYENALIDITELEAIITALNDQFKELVDTIERWLSTSSGNYEFSVTIDGVYVGNYVWEIGLSNTNEAIWNTYYWNGFCYKKNEAASLGENAEAYFSDVSFNDLGVIAYNVDATTVGISGYDTVIVWDRFTKTSDGGINVVLDVYDNSWNLIRRLTNVGGPLYPSTNMIFCE